MKLIPTRVAGVWLIEMHRHRDERGWFARTWCARELAEHGLDVRVSQCSSSFNLRKGTLRGMHYQVAPHEEVKIVRCTRGAIFDVVLDLRPASPTFKQWTGEKLGVDNGRALYVPEGCAHGFQALEDDSELLYMNSAEFHPASARGVRWNDPAFAIQWPLPNVAIMNDRDRHIPDFATAELF